MYKRQGLVRALLLLIPAASMRIQAEKIAAIAGLFAAFSYLFMSGMAISTCRAVIMTSIFYLAILQNKPALTLQNLLLSALILLLIWPYSLMEAGFQMSYAAATALILGYNAIRRLKSFLIIKYEIKHPQGFMFSLFYRGCTFFGTLAMTSIIAGIATAPFGIYHFQNAAPLGLIGNILAMPIIAFIVMPMGLSALLLMPYGLHGWPLKVMAKGLDNTLNIAEIVSRHPFSDYGHISLSSMGFFALISILFLCLIGKGRVLFIAPLFALVGIMSPADQFGDILISSQNYTVAVKQPNGQYSIWGRDSLTRRIWEKKLPYDKKADPIDICLLYTSPSPRDA